MTRGGYYGAGLGAVVFPHFSFFFSLTEGLGAQVLAHDSWFLVPLEVIQTERSGGRI